MASLAAPFGNLAGSGKSSKERTWDALELAEHSLAANSISNDATGFAVAAPGATSEEEQHGLQRLAAGHDVYLLCRVGNAGGSMLPSALMTVKKRVRYRRCTDLG